MKGFYAAPRLYATEAASYSASEACYIRDFHHIPVFEHLNKNVLIFLSVRIDLLFILRQFVRHLFRSSLLSAGVGIDEL